MSIASVNNQKLPEMNKPVSSDQTDLMNRIKGIALIILGIGLVAGTIATIFLLPTLPMLAVVIAGGVTGISAGFISLFTGAYFLDRNSQPKPVIQKEPIFDLKKELDEKGLKGCLKKTGGEEICRHANEPWLKERLAEEIRRKSSEAILEYKWTKTRYPAYTDPNGSIEYEECHLFTTPEFYRLFQVELKKQSQEMDVVTFYKKHKTYSYPIIQASRDLLDELRRAIADKSIKEIISEFGVGIFQFNIIDPNRLSAMTLKELEDLPPGVVQIILSYRSYGNN